MCILLVISFFSLLESDCELLCFAEQQIDDHGKTSKQLYYTRHFEDVLDLLVNLWP